MIQQVEAAAAWKLWLLEVSFVALLAEMKAQEKRQDIHSSDCTNLC